MAKRGSRTIRALLRETLRNYYAQDARRALLEIGEYAESRNSLYAEAEVPRLIQEMRDEKTR